MKAALRSVGKFVSEHLFVIILVSVFLTGGILLSRYIVKVTDLTDEVKVAERIRKMDSIEEMETYLQKEGVSYSIDNQRNISIDFKGPYCIDYVFADNKFTFDKYGKIYEAVIFRRQFGAMDKEDLNSMKKEYNKDGTIKYERVAAGDDEYLLIIESNEKTVYANRSIIIEEVKGELVSCKDLDIILFIMLLWLALIFLFIIIIV